MLVAAIILALALVAGSFPVYAWVQQSAQLHQSADQLAALQAKNRQLAKEAAALRNPAAVERIAESQYGLTPKGSRTYVILPPSTTTTTVPPTSSRQG